MSLVTLSLVREGGGGGGGEELEEEEEEEEEEERSWKRRRRKRRRRRGVGRGGHIFQLEPGVSQSCLTCNSLPEIMIEEIGLKTRTQHTLYIIYSKTLRPPEKRTASLQWTAPNVSFIQRLHYIIL